MKIYTKQKDRPLAYFIYPEEFLIDISKKFQGAYPDWVQQLRKRDEAREQQINVQAAEKLNGMNPAELFRKLDPILGDKHNTYCRWW